MSAQGLPPDAVPQTWPVQVLRASMGALLADADVEVVPDIDSTNTELMRRVRAGHAAPMLLVAESQSAGRGRLGRHWSSVSGDSLTFSLGMLLRPVDWSGLSLAVGVSIAESLHPDIQLKWPNDLWWQDRKLAGILIETASVPGVPGARYAVIGVGINIRPGSLRGLNVAAASLQELRPGIDAGQALLALAAPLVGAVLQFQATGFAPWQARFAARDALRDRAVNLSDGTHGVACGVSETGALLVHTSAAMVQITSSEVSVRPAPV